MKEDMRNKTACFTGHRIIPKDQYDSIAARTEITIRELILKQGIRFFGVGGAIGYDTQAAQILFRLRETDFPQIKVILVYPFDGFDSRWTDEQRATYTQMFPKYDKHVCVAPEASREAYLARNRRLVDYPSICVAYCTRNSGGTAYTVRYAEYRERKIYNIAEGLTND